MRRSTYVLVWITASSFVGAAAMPFVIPGVGGWIVGAASLALAVLMVFALTKSRVHARNLLAALQGGDASMIDSVRVQTLRTGPAESAYVHVGLRGGGKLALFVSNTKDVAPIMAAFQRVAPAACEANA